MDEKIKEIEELYIKSDGTTQNKHISVLLSRIKELEEELNREITYKDALEQAETKYNVYYKFGDKVFAEKGFYEGMKGKVLGTKNHEWSGSTDFLVKFDKVEVPVWVDSWDLWYQSKEKACDEVGPSIYDAINSMQDDLVCLLRVLGLKDCARDESPHKVMIDEVIPAVEKLKTEIVNLKWKLVEPDLEVTEKDTTSHGLTKPVMIGIVKKVI